MSIKARREPNLSTKRNAFVYQSDALDAVKPLEYAALFHEQGLGKTKIAIDLALWWLTHGTVDSVLVVTKRGLVDNWKSEFEEHTFIEPRILGQDRAANFRALNSPSRVYLTHYEVLSSEHSRFALFLKTRAVGVFLDEAHKIKNPATALTMAFFELRNGFKKRIILTGTPIANRPQDIWSQIFFLDGGKALGSDYEAFKKRVNLSNRLSTSAASRLAFEDALAEISTAIRPFTIRETKATANIVLPDKVLATLTVPMEHRQQELYDQYCRELSSIIVRDGEPTRDDADVILKRLTRLLQLASNPLLVDDSYVNVPGKLQPLRTLIGQAFDRREKTIVWTAFINNSIYLSQELSDYGAATVHGALSLEERNEALRRFRQDDQCSVLVATQGAAKEGLTLTVANNAIFYDRSLSLDDYLQAQDRIHRISQERDCYITSLISEGSIDEWVDSLLEAKRSAARLAQGDIDKALFQGEMSYDYGLLLMEILSARRKNTV